MLLHPFRRSRDRDGGSDDFDGLRRSLSEGGALARLPGPVFLIDRDGAVAASNRDAHPLRGWLADGAPSPLDKLRERLDGQQEAIELMHVPGGQPDQAMELRIARVGAGLGMLIIGRDVTRSTRLRGQLSESRERYRELVEIGSDFAWETGPNGTFTFVPRGTLGWRAEDLLGASPLKFLLNPASDDADRLFLTRVPVEEVELWFRRAEGVPACMIGAARPLFGPDGTWRGARGVCRDVTEDRERDAALVRARNRERLLTTIVRTVRDEMEPANMLATAAAAIGPAIAAAGCTIYRLTPDGFVEAAKHGTIPAAETVPDLVARLAGDPELVVAEIAGRRCLAVGTRFRDMVNGALCLWRQPSDSPWNADERELSAEVALQLGIAIQQVAGHEELQRISATDALTGLTNRRTFIADLPRLLARADSAVRPAALAYVDLDNFKSVNDIRGHQAGDEVLRKLADLLQRHTRQEDLVSRLGGDEFAVLLGGADAAGGLRWGEALLAAARTALLPLSGEPSKPLGLSIGIAIYRPGSRETVENLTHRADLAMYEVKRAGKGTVRLAAEPETV